MGASGAAKGDEVLRAVAVVLTVNLAVIWYFVGWLGCGIALATWLLPYPNPSRRYIGWAILSYMGFRFKPGCEYELPRDLDKLPKKFLVIGEPHTHIWDFMIMQAFFAYYGMPPVYVLVSNKYTRIPVFGSFLKLIGALEVDTASGKKGGMVEQAVAKIKAADRLVLHVPPSGKRTKTPYWRSGFYHIAHLAGVPVIPAWLDASTRTFGFNAPISITGDLSSDMDKFRAVYKDKRGFVPEFESVVRLEKESSQ